MSQYPKISIVMPSLNQGRFIEDAILSVLNQGYENFEHIVIDGASTDNTLKVLNKYPHLIWISEPDKGQSDALNKGFHTATGEIIAWLNADDYFLPGAFTTIANYAKQYPKFEVFLGSFYFVDRNGKYFKEMRSIPFFRSMAVYNFCYPGSGAFFRRAVFEKGFFLNKDFHYIMDLEFYVRLNKVGVQFKAIPEFLSCFRLHEANQSMQFLKASNGKERAMHAERHERERRLFHDMYGMRLGNNAKFNCFLDRTLTKLFKYLRGAIRLLRGDYLFRAKNRLYIPVLIPPKRRIKQS